ncbi:MAG: helix-turn-helix transcriptional regulator [Candidatus Buchananbacteria bacterium]
MPKTIHTDEYQRITERLKQARVDADFTQEEVAKRIKKPQSYVSKIEAGEQRIDIIELKVFAKLYKKEVDYFIQ